MVNQIIKPNQRIGILVNSLAHGGAERIALVSLNELRRKGFDVYLICLEKEAGYTPPRDIPVIYLTNFNKITHPLIKVPLLFLCAFRLLRIVQRYQIDFIQSHLIRSNIINVAARYVGARHRSQLVSHLPMNFKQDPAPVAWLKATFYNWFYRRADEVLSISQMMKYEINEALKLDRYDVQHRVVYNPHDLQLIRERAKEEPGLFQFDPEKKYIISAGRQLKHKHVEVTIEALHLLRKTNPKVELLVLGDGKDRPFFEQYAADRGVSSYVHFLGNRPNPFSYIARSDVFVLSSELEGLPNILIESLTCGTPVISSDCLSGPREILHPESDFLKRQTDELEYGLYGLLYPVGRADLLMEGLQRLLSDPALCHDYAEAGKDYVERFDKSRITSEYIENLIGKSETEEIKVSGESIPG